MVCAAQHHVRDSAARAFSRKADELQPGPKVRDAEPSFVYQFEEDFMATSDDNTAKAVNKAADEAARKMTDEAARV